jgi:hypothetical protein
MTDALKAHRDVAARYYNTAHDQHQARKAFILSDRRFDGIDAEKLLKLLDWNRDGNTAAQYIQENLK